MKQPKHALQQPNVLSLNLHVMKVTYSIDMAPEYPIYIIIVKRIQCRQAGRPRRRV